MSGFVYTAKIAPIGRDISMPGDAVRPLVLDETTWQAWCEEPWHVGVWTNHERSSQAGRCMLIRARDGWYQAEFFLDDAIERHLPEGLPVGQPISVGIRNFRDSIFLLQEISIVPKGAIRGAEIVSRTERKARRAPVVAAKPTPKPTSTVAARPSAPATAAKAPLNKHAHWVQTQSAPASREWWRTPKGQDVELRRRLEAADYREGSFEMILQQMEDELFLFKNGYPRYQLKAP